MASAESRHKGGLGDETDAGGWLLQNRRFTERTSQVIFVNTAALSSQLGIAEPTTLQSALNSPKPEGKDSSGFQRAVAYMDSLQVHVYIHMLGMEGRLRRGAGRRRRSAGSVRASLYHVFSSPHPPISASFLWHVTKNTKKMH